VAPQPCDEAKKVDLNCEFGAYAVPRLTWTAPLLPMLACASHARDPHVLAAVEFADHLRPENRLELPEGSDWKYELKFDGYRALGIKSAGQAVLATGTNLRRVFRA
jgi:ATP-dependent DNA ligase